MNALVAMFCKKLDNDFSYKINRANQLMEIVVITAKESKRALSVYFDFETKEIYFWNDFDQKFVQSLNINGIDSLIKCLEKELDKTFFIDFIKSGEIVSTYPVQLSKPTKQKIAEKIDSLLPYEADFEYILFTNFSGKTSHSIKFVKDNIIFV